MKKILIRGAREHNLQNIDLDLPREKLIVVTGLSGSGKSSLAFDTLYAEGQRRYVESLSAYARQFLGLMNKPDVDRIEGLSPAISIEQKTTSRNPRSTVGTVTEIYDYLRLLFARIGIPHCPEHGHRIAALTPESIADAVQTEFSGRVTLLTPIVRQKKGTYGKLFQELHKEGILRARVDGTIVRTDEKIDLGRYEMHSIEAVLDRLECSNRSRLVEAVERALTRSEGLAIVLAEDGQERLFSSRLACPECGLAFEELQPRAFSFNSPFGACEICSGLGFRQDFAPELILPEPELAIADGAVALYRNVVDGWRGQYLEAVADHFGFSVQTPVGQLDERQRQALLYGSPDDIRFDFVMKGGDAHWSHKGRWEGLIPQSERLYKQTESDYRRRELERFMRISPCPACAGRRLKAKTLAVTIRGCNIHDVTDMNVVDAAGFFARLNPDPREQAIAAVILREIESRLAFLEKVGLDYLTLTRAAGTLSGGEAQRIRLATQIGTNLTGVLYILDEPSIGLHPRDNQRLIETLRRLRDLGNTLVVVEHDEETIRCADWVVDLGPGAGRNGGQIVVAGTPARVEKSRKSLTGAYLSGRMSIQPPEKRRQSRQFLTLKNCHENNLKNIDVRIPQSVLTLITGVSGSGKSTLVDEILYKAMMQKLHGSTERPGAHGNITLDEPIDRVLVIDQSPIGRTPRSNPATYTKVFDEIRKIFANTREARIRGYAPGRFSFNVPGGRCEACSGDGLIRIEMNFLPDVYVECEECKGARYNRETLEVKFQDKSIADVLAMTVEEARDLFEVHPPIRRRLDTLLQVGLSYIQLGQSATTLSGGEAQRIKLTRELGKKATGRTLYLLDEPTTGLHFHDTGHLINLLQSLVDQGNSVVVIEHNLDVICAADHVIDLGPEGGDRGGEIVAEGTPEEIARCEESYTGKYIAAHLERLTENRGSAPSPARDLRPLTPIIAPALPRTAGKSRRKRGNQE